MGSTRDANSGWFGELLTDVLKLILVVAAIFFIKQWISGGGMGAIFGSREQTVSKDGFSITVPGDFRETTQAGFNGALTSSNAAIGWEKASFSEFLGYGIDLSAYSQADVLNLMASGNGWQNVQWYGHDTLGTYVTHESGEWKYLDCVYRGSDGYWWVMFTCEKEAFLSQWPDFLEWAGTVRVS